MYRWQIDKWKKLSWNRKTYDMKLGYYSRKIERREYRKKLIADGIVKVYPLSKCLYGVMVQGVFAGAWSSAQQGHEIMTAVCDTVYAMIGVSSMMNEGVESKTTTIRQSMPISKEDVTKWVAEKGAVKGASELKELVYELSAALQEATSDVFKKHPECAAFFGVCGRVEIATSIDGKKEDALSYLGFGPGCNMEYVEELERWSEEKSDRCRNCSSGECECGSDDIPSPAPKIDKLMRSLKALKALNDIMNEAASDKEDDE